MKYLALAMLLAVMQTSAPVPRKAADPSNRASQNVKNDSSKNQPPAQQTPTVVQPISPKPDQNGGHGPAAEDAQKPVVVRELPPVSVTKDWWDRLYIGFTGILIIVGILGVRAAYKTLREMKVQRETMQGQLTTTQDQLTQMKDSGRQTDSLITQATIQAEKTGIAADAAKKSADAARESIILTHRPKIVVRDMVVAWPALVKRGTCVKKLNENQFDEWQLGGAFYIVNTGNQSATVVSLEQFMSFDDFLPFERPVESGVRKFVAIKLKPGESKRIPFHPIAIGTPDTRTLTFGVPMTAIGRIVYEDELGNQRETGFARKFEMKRQRFIAMDDHDYEYAD
jgi:hypothetical protein